MREGMRCLDLRRPAGSPPVVPTWTSSSPRLVWPVGVVHATPEGGSENRGAFHEPTGPSGRGTRLTEIGSMHFVMLGDIVFDSAETLTKRGSQSRSRLDASKKREKKKKRKQRADEVRSSSSSVQRLAEVEHVQVPGYTCVACVFVVQPNHGSPDLYYLCRHLIGRRNDG